jgi:hypothetical protein
MSGQSENDKGSLSGEESKLIEMEHEETVIETEDHHGFTDAARVTRLKSDAEALECEIVHEKEQLKDEGR